MQCEFCAFPKWDAGGTPNAKQENRGWFDGVIVFMSIFCCELKTLVSILLEWVDTKEFKRGHSGLFLTHVNAIWGIGHIACHVRWRVIVPSDLARSFSVICAHYCYHYLSSHGERQLTHNKIIWRGIAAKQSGGTKPHLHMWRQDDHYNRFPLWISLVDT